MGINKCIDEYEFIELLKDEQILKGIDWSGENENGEIISFVLNKIKTYHNENIIIDEDNIYSLIKNNLDKRTLKKGDTPIIIFNKLDKQLKKYNYRIIFIDTGNDEYVFTVVNKNDYTKLLKNMKINFTGIPKEDDKALEVIKCEKCGTIFFPEFGAGETGEGVYCNCGKLLYTYK
ncbi:MAG: hypothetical protein LBS73_03665 [Campylobacteraceae bacterium]|nr:hypothetical protein [Campylobacteraceae bacterium]